MLTCGLERRENGPPQHLVALRVLPVLRDHGLQLRQLFVQARPAVWRHVVAHDCAVAAALGDDRLRRIVGCGGITLVGSARVIAGGYMWVLTIPLVDVIQW